MARVAKQNSLTTEQKRATAPTLDSAKKGSATLTNREQKAAPASARKTAPLMAADKVQKSKPAERKTRDRQVVPNTFRLGYLLHDVSRMRRTLFDQHMKPEGLTRSQWWVLANLSRKNGSGTMSTDLARQLCVGKVTVGGLVDRLEAAGYVYRRTGKADRRSKLIFISVKGYEVISRMRKITEMLNREFVIGMTEQEIELMEQYLFLMKQNVRNMLGDTAVSDDDE